MLRTNKTRLDDIIYWIEYEDPKQQDNGSWVTIGYGKVHYYHECGKQNIGQTGSKKAYGRTRDEAIVGVKKRVLKILLPIVEFISKTKSLDI